MKVGKLPGEAFSGDDGRHASHELDAGVKEQQRQTGGGGPSAMLRQRLGAELVGPAHLHIQIHHQRSTCPASTDLFPRFHLRLRLSSLLCTPLIPQHLPP
jgi:hypothetical protein